jgi:hypothetical protein
MALFFGAVLLLVEKMILQIIGKYFNVSSKYNTNQVTNCDCIILAIRFHRTAYRDRILQNKNEFRSKCYT